MIELKKIIEETQEINKEYHYLNAISEDLALESSKNSKGKLKDVIISVKDCICVKGVESTAGSAILKGYNPVFDATVVERVKKEGGIIIGKTAQDEFGFGSFSINVGVGFKIPLNPFDKERVCGGSSGGSAGFTQKSGFRHISLSESTGGSIVAPASFCSVVGLCPTYGRVSRYGLMDYANSLDKIGPIAMNVYDAALLLEVIAGFDKKESTSLDAPVDEYTQFVNKDVKGMKIGIIKESFGEGTDKEVSNAVKETIKKLESKGVKAEEVSLPITFEYGIPCYYLIATSEASTNLAKYCGMRYGASEKLEGNFNEYFTDVRSNHLGQEAKRRIMLGTFARMAGYRDAYYIKAMKVRTKIIEEYKNLFKKYDALVCPTMPVLPPKIKETEKLTPLQNYMMDIMTVGPNLAGLPHISVPSGFVDDLPVGIMFIGDHLMEKKIIQLASWVKPR
jgi:aspartyl-tRNA(Asn)/glutamyl-tRNA(Gln) amidotransferase subunit A